MPRGHRPNEYLVLDDGIATLTITRQNGQPYVVTFDAIDIDLVKQYTWHIKWVRDSTGKLYHYAQTNVPDGVRKQRKVTLAAHLLNLDHTSDLVTHYRNGDTLDCRRSNILITDRAGALADVDWKAPATTGERYIDRRPNGRYHVQLSRAYGAPYIGMYDTLLEAVQARDQWLADHAA